MAKQVNIKSFGAAGAQSYFFSNVVKAVTNFSTVSSKVSPLTGFDGGIDEFGTGYAPRNVGRVIVDFWLVAHNDEVMTELRDNVAQMPFWGVRELFITPYNDTEPDRWCYARCVDVSMPEDANVMTQLSQPVTAMFEVANPFWYSREGLVWIGEPNLEISSSNPWTIKGARINQVPVDGDIIIIDYTGKAPTPVSIEIDANGGSWYIGEPGILIGQPNLFIGGYGGFSDIKIRQYNESNLLLEEWHWNGALFHNGERLVVDGDALSIRKESVLGSFSGWPDFEIIKGSGFIRLYPGINKIKLNGNFSGGTIRISYNDAWA